MKYELYHAPRGYWYIEALREEDHFHTMAGFTTKKAAMHAYESWQEMFGKGPLKIVKINAERTYYQWSRH